MNQRYHKFKFDAAFFERIGMSKNAFQNLLFVSNRGEEVWGTTHRRDKDQDFLEVALFEEKSQEFFEKIICGRPIHMFDIYGLDDKIDLKERIAKALIQMDPKRYWIIENPTCGSEWIIMDKKEAMELKLCG